MRASKRYGVRLAAMLVASVVVITGMNAAPASADFNQNWNTSASYRLSLDWVPYQTSVSQWGKSCSGGEAAYFRVRVKVTSNGEVVWGSQYTASDGSVWYLGSASLGINRAYYHRWDGYRANFTTAFSPCQYVGAGGANGA